MSEQVVGTGKFCAHRHCCFCGAVHHPNEPLGYAGEKTCAVCGKGGNGELDEPDMFYKRIGGCMWRRAPLCLLRQRGQCSLRSRKDGTVCLAPRSMFRSLFGFTRWTDTDQKRASLIARIPMPTRFCGVDWIPFTLLASERPKRFVSA
jgi:hypothetical protein